MSLPKRDIKAVFLAERTVIDANDCVGKIVKFLDRHGQETTDLFEAEVAVVRWEDNGLWSPVTLLKSDLTNRKH